MAYIFRNNNYHNTMIPNPKGPNVLLILAITMGSIEFIKGINKKLK